MIDNDDKNIIFLNLWMLSQVPASSHDDKNDDNDNLPRKANPSEDEGEARTLSSATLIMCIVQIILYDDHHMPVMLMIMPP